MNAMILLLGAFAILLIALAIILWHGAEARMRQQAAGNLIDRHLQGGSAAPVTREHERTAVSFGGLKSRAWKNFLLRAGVTPNRTFHIMLVLPGIALTMLAATVFGALSAACTLLLYALLRYFHLWYHATRRHQKAVRQLPGFLDTMVRLATLGNSIESAFQSAIPTTDAPLRELLDRANRLIQAGMNLDQALVQEARVFRLVELELIASVIGVALRFGGRADKVLERMSAFMRDREQAQNELVALSAETRLSAWVLALLPIGLGLFMMIFNNRMFSIMLNDPVGWNLLMGAVLLEIVGAVWLYRLAKSV